MDRIDFIGQIYGRQTLSSIDDVVEFFDHSMAAYEVLQPIKTMSMDSITDKLQSLMIIKIECPDQSKLGSIEGYVNNVIHNQKNLYGKTFYINTNVVGPSVELSVQEVS